mmetsp:Transcript_29397/g.56444  ORF Transcript_29397/g.56444 Transcript_29397/m.56444 type:complete len:390 (-) Transcript_29397:387-1556(-)
MANQNQVYYDYDKQEWSACSSMNDWSCLSCFLGRSLTVNPVSNSFQGQHQGGRYLHEAHPCMDLDSRVVGQGTVRMPSPNSSGPSYQVRYAYISQKGYHPSKVNWICQDDCVVIPNYAGRGDNLFMGVFDGHGIVGEGDLAARKAKETMPNALQEAMNTTGNVVTAYEESFERTSAKLCRELLRESGCTAVGALIRGHELHVANCGDTRAVLGKQGPGRSRVVAAPLSNDHKAFRKDERERILRNFPNTEVLTFGMKDGKVPISDDFGESDDPDVSADPPRVWIKGQTFPGCSYTRSLGDAVAKQTGILSTPEVFSHRLNPMDKFVVLCTDGITEFLSNDDIVGFCMKNPDPLDACEELVQTAFNWFVDDDGWTDDITVVVAYLDWETS